MKLITPLTLAYLAWHPLAQANDAYPPDVATWGNELKLAQRGAAKKLVAHVAAAMEKGDTEFRIPPGHYRFNRHGPKQFELRSVQDLIIEASGVTFWFDGRFRTDAVSLVGCKNVTIRGLTVDYDPMPYAQGEIVKIDRTSKTVDIRVDSGFPLPDASWTKVPGKIKAVFYGEDRRMIEVRMDWVKALEPLGDRVYRVSFKFGWIFEPIYKSDIKLGDYLCLPDRSMRMSFMSSGCERVTLEDITVYSCPHMAFTEVGGEGGHVYRRCKVIRRPGTKRLMACNADVFHSNTTRRGPTIEGCEFSHSGDDFVNIHGFFFMVYEQRSPTQLVLANQYQPDCYAVGSELGFYAFADFGPLGKAKVLKMTAIEDRDTFEACKRMPAELRKQRHNVRDFHPRNIYPYLVDLDQPVEAAKYDVVGCSYRAGNGAVVRNNYLHDGFSRGILLKCSHAVVAGNRIERDGTGSIAVAAERFWMEGPFVRDVVIKDNTIVDPGRMFLSHNWNTAKLGAITVVSQAHVGLTRGCHNENIRIVGNRIVRPAACGIAVMNARDCTIAGNTIEEPFSKEPVRFGSSLRVDRPHYAIYLAAASHIVVKGNTIVRPSSHCLGRIGLGPNVASGTIAVSE